MAELRPDKIPESLQRRSQWLVWKSETKGDKPTKVPYQAKSGAHASHGDPATWCDFGAAWQAFTKSADKYAGVGYVFSANDNFCGIDLDGCRDPESGEVAEWAREIIRELATYAEVSPSQTGVKLFCIAKSPLSGGKKKQLDCDGLGGKEAAIEVYDQLRYFAVTGWRIRGGSVQPEARQSVLNELCRKHWPEEFVDRHRTAPQTLDSQVAERARRYVSRIPGAVSGSGGHNQTFKTACILVLGFGLDRHEAFAVLEEWNEICQPPWTAKELWHKIDDAAKQPGERNYLRDARPEDWHKVDVPEYKAPAMPPKHRPVILMEAAVENYITHLECGRATPIELGIAEVDYAIGGGVEQGEMVIIAARPGHGKTSVALQCLHNSTSAGKPCLFISEEMSALALGKRTLQFVSDVHQEHWKGNIEQLRREATLHFASRSKLYVAESRVTADAAAETIREAVRDQAVELAVIDYAQLLSGSGRTRYEQVTHTSLVLRQITTELNVTLLVLCQLNRSIDNREKFIPKLSDLKDSGQLEQDADVILFLVWPLRLNPAHKPHDDYQVFVAKNRNRPINQEAVKCRFVPSRQMVMPERPSQSAWVFDREG